MSCDPCHQVTLSGDSPEYTLELPRLEIDVSEEITGCPFQKSIEASFAAEDCLGCRQDWRTIEGVGHKDAGGCHPQLPANRVHGAMTAKARLNYETARWRFVQQKGCRFS